MSDSDLDRYLEGIGINVGEEDPAAENLAHLDEPEPELEEFDVAAYDAAIVVQGDPAERAETFLVNLLLNIDPGYAVEIDAVTDEEVFVEVYGGDPGKIIGRAGRTLAALEYVTNAVVNREGERPTRVNIDVGGYKRRRDARLRDTALAAAARVRKNGVAVELEPMTAAERRVVHMALAEEAGVTTESTGEGAERRVVVKPA
ncbi:MAG TPA: R3H domain-containing nucleic acid-binding protein [Trueperaceae bacterium]|jgi:spoIIIJ-associated protein|nr:R3H domain-containing nucleic acid-binding protein [Trueperaceae bacterium]